MGFLSGVCSSVPLFLQYIVLLFLIVILEIVAGILGFVFQDEVIEVSESRAAEAINDFLPDGNPNMRSDVNSIVNFLQNQVCVYVFACACTCMCTCVCMHMVTSCFCLLVCFAV